MDYNYIKKDWKWGPSIWSGSNENKAAGLGLLCRGSFYKTYSVTEIVPGRAVITHLSFKGQCFKILNVYAPAEKQERCELFETLPLFCTGSTPLLVCGDFNCIKVGESRQGGDTNRKDKSSNLLQNFIDDFKLKDAWKEFYKDAGFTWSNNKISSRIDFMFLSDAFYPFKCVLLDNLFSDHKLLNFHLNVFRDKKVKKGNWRLNVQILEDDHMCKKFVRTYRWWQRTRKPDESMLHWWENTKPKIKMFFIQAGKKKAREKKSMVF